MFRSLVLLATAGLALAACDSTDPVVDPVNLDVRTAADVAADPAPRDRTTGQVTGAATGRYTFYSLRENRVVLNYDNPNRADSASTAWDLAVRGTTILINGGTSGPGAAAAVVVVGSFDEITGVPPTTTFRTDGAAESTCPGANTPNGPVPGTPRAICTGSDNGWYNYNQPQNLVSPLSGRTILVRTADGQGYAKVQIQSYYRGAPAAPVTAPGSGNSEERFYTFKYVFNPAGTSFIPVQ